MSTPQTPTRTQAQAQARTQAQAQAQAQAQTQTESGVIHAARQRLRLLEEVLRATPCAERADLATLRDAVQRRQLLLDRLPPPSGAAAASRDPELAELEAQAQHLIGEIFERDRQILLLLEEARRKTQRLIQQAGVEPRAAARLVCRTA